MAATAGGSGGGSSINAGVGSGVTALGLAILFDQGEETRVSSWVRLLLLLLLLMVAFAM